MNAESHAVRQVLAVLNGLPGHGLVVELAPPDDALGNALTAAGLSYARADLDPSDLTVLAAHLAGLGPIRAICMRGTLGRLAEPGRVLDLLASFSAAHGRCPLVVVEANAGQVDLALRRLAGVATGSATTSTPGVMRELTGTDLASLLHGHGWALAARHDLDAAVSDSADAQSLLLGTTLIGDLLRQMAATFNPDSRIGQFVWLLEPVDTPVAASEVVSEPAERPGPLLSILMRTQGRRNERLTEALCSIFAQTCDDYEVVLCFHDPDRVLAARRAGVEAVVAGLPAPLRERTRLISCHEPGRGAPLNAMLEAARGTYASILDDDDLLFDQHVETIRDGVERHGRQVLFQTYAAQRLIESVPVSRVPEGAQETGAPGPDNDAYTVVGMSVPWARPLDLVLQHHENMAPICCLAVPLALARQTLLRFRTDLDVGEEWAFWMEALQVLRVVVLPEVTAAVNHWNDATSNAMLRPDLAPLWRRVRDERHARASAVPVVLDGPARGLLAEAGRQREELAWLRTELLARDARLASIQRSRLWRLALLIWQMRAAARRGWRGRR